MSKRQHGEPTERQLDEWLDSYAVPPAGKHLRNRILTAAREQPPHGLQAVFGAIQELILAIGGWRIAGPALALSLIMGIGLNLYISSSAQPGPTVTVWQLSMLSTAQDLHNE